MCAAYVLRSIPAREATTRFIGLPVGSGATPAATNAANANGTTNFGLRTVYRVDGAQQLDHDRRHEQDRGVVRQHGRGHRRQREHHAVRVAHWTARVGLDPAGEPREHAELGGGRRGRHDADDDDQRSPQLARGQLEIGEPCGAARERDRHAGEGADGGRPGGTPAERDRERERHGEEREHHAIVAKEPRGVGAARTPTATGAAAACDASPACRGT
jgi:hypothetical protein